ncbi:hypothetical protein CpecG_0462 [Chlamydia pecorum MC/MarsBar]|nr:hypothetical protein CpecS_0467 [Chlamydia pecorum VR629]ETF39363.1 hypothetical protein CpecF_0463 [Chlamydia pecorum DBDeUG]ETF40037.1 hypothetical protein CpecG_0462 [Chlamydia pecorum MC/MarsBar]ETF40570.1 hypothetical protein CpecA_0464 [Chlamydia pecorum IPTaLE]
MWEGKYKSLKNYSLLSSIIDWANSLISLAMFFASCFVCFAKASVCCFEFLIKVLPFFVPEFLNFVSFFLSCEPLFGVNRLVSSVARIPPKSTPRNQEKCFRFTFLGLR